MIILKEVRGINSYQHNISIDIFVVEEKSHESGYGSHCNSEPNSYKNLLKGLSSIKYTSIIFCSSQSINFKIKPACEISTYVLACIGVIVRTHKDSMVKC